MVSLGGLCYWVTGASLGFICVGWWVVCVGIGASGIYWCFFFGVNSFGSRCVWIIVVI